MDSEVREIHKLTGRQTPEGWKIGPLIVPKAYQTGGWFSVGYLAENEDGRRGFFKALDFAKVLGTPNSAESLKELLDTFIFERDVLEYCKRLSKVVLAIGSGELDVPGVPLDKVYYLVFELAEGDVRAFARKPNEYEAIWALKALHNIAVGLKQLHASDVFHQDLKPSNVLVFSGGTTTKIADFGRAHCRRILSPHDDLGLPGARMYAPPEQLYAYQMEDRAKGRCSSDLFLLGSMLHFFFTGAMFTPALITRLRPEHKPPLFAEGDNGWQGYYRDVLPFLEEATGATVTAFSERVGQMFTAIGHAAEGRELASLLRYLVGPNPHLRGHPSDRGLKHGNEFDLNRFVSAFDRIARRCNRGFRMMDATTA